MATLSVGTDSSRDSFEHFASRKSMSSMTFSIAPREGDSYHQPLRRPHRFGNDYKSSHNQLDESLGNLMKNYKARATAEGKNNLVLVLFEYPAEWAFLVQFPSIIPYFSEWLDVRSLAHELAPQGVTPGLCDMLKCFGYSSLDIWPKPDKSAGPGNSHNAGNDSVLTLAALENLLVPSNQIKLQLQQKCHQIASLFETPDLSRLPFTANIEALDGKPLPKELRCAAKVAQVFLNHCSPIRTGVRRLSLTERDQQRHARKIISAWIAFKTLDDLNCFIRKAQHITISGRVLKMTSLYNPNSNEDRISDARKEALRQERAERRIAAEKFDIGDLLIPW
ncbi:hypothetical protein F4679DRAFT_533355 [Xylaria curta]|nr:hypothetical protein F4679DRAFT_533355 [Xylaria curta]